MTEMKSPSGQMRESKDRGSSPLGGHDSSSAKPLEEPARLALSGHLRSSRPTGRWVERKEKKQRRIPGMRRTEQWRPLVKLLLVVCVVEGNQFINWPQWNDALLVQIQRRLTSLYVQTHSWLIRSLFFSALCGSLNMFFFLSFWFSDVNYCCFYEILCFSVKYWKKNKQNFLSFLPFKDVMDN